MAWVLSAGLLADAAAAAAAACMAPVIIGQTFLVKGGVGGNERQVLSVRKGRWGSAMWRQQSRC